MQLTKNMRTHLAILKDREIPLTREQYNSIKLSTQDNGYHFIIKIVDPDTGKTLYDGKQGSIMEFEEIKQVDSKRYICDFGVSHPIHDQCECKKKYGLSPVEFREKMRKFGILYSSDVNDSNRNKILAL